MHRLENVLAERIESVTLRATMGPGTAGPIAAEMVGGGADLVVAAGGDGTVNEVIEGMVGSTVPLGVLPAGTANVLANEMGLGSRPAVVARTLTDCIPRRISLGRLTCRNGTSRTRHFLLMAGAGLDAEIVYHVNAPLKQAWGKLAYWLGGARMVGRRLVEFEIHSGERRQQCSFALVSKVRNYGGDFEIARETTLLDDCFEVVLFEGNSSLRYLKYLAGVAMKRTAGLSGVTTFRTSRIDLLHPQDQRVYIQVDGEYAGHLPATIEIVPDALTLLMPETYLRRALPA